MVHLSALDVVVLCLFLGAIFALGFSARLREATPLQYIAAGRALSLPAFVATLVSTWYGGILGIGESVSLFGLGTWVLLGLPYYVFGVVYALVLAPRVRQADQISLPERFEATWGRGPALAGATLLFLLGVPAAHVLMLGVLAQGLTGWPLWLCVILGTAFGAAFLVRGGLMADVRASMLAFAMMYIGFVVLVVTCLVNHPLPVAWAGLEPRTLFAWDGGQGVLVVTSFFILGAWTLIDPGFHQRVASARSPRTAQKGILASVGFWMLFDLLTITAGMYALALLPDRPENPLMLFPMLGEMVLPPGLKALFFCGMLGTIVSAMVGYTLVSGSTVGRDIVARVRRGASLAQETQWSRWGILAACSLAIALALSVGSVVALWFSWSGAVVGAMLLPVAMSYGILPKASPTATLVAMVLSFLVSAGWMAFGLATNNPYLVVTLPDGTSFGLGTLLPGVVVSALVFLLAGAGVKRRP